MEMGRRVPHIGEILTSLDDGTDNKYTVYSRVLMNGW